MIVPANSATHAGVTRSAFAGTITAVTYTPRTTLTGAATDSRTVTVVNETQSKTAATLAFTSGVNATAVTPKVITVSGTAANVAVAAGDVITVKSTHVGSTGLADPGGLFSLTFRRA